jgi:hypothetical protein
LAGDFSSLPDKPLVVSLTVLRGLMDEKKYAKLSQ